MLRFIVLLVALWAAIGGAPASAEAPTITEGHATTPDGIRLYYRVAGSGEETVIVPFALYHGSALDALAEGRRVVTYDPRGRGKSQAAPLDRVSLDYLLSDLETVRRAVGAERVALIGWSGGGMETFVYTLRNPETRRPAGPARARNRAGAALYRRDERGSRAPHGRRGERRLAGEDRRRRFRRRPGGPMPRRKRGVRARADG
jgi:pimeloyl-ACP methyl ester carboxylesterase